MSEEEKEEKEKEEEILKEDEEILNQEEVDALIGDDEASDPVDKSTPQSFDFASQEKIVRGRMPTLEMIGDRYIRNFKLSLYNMLRKTVEVTANPIKIAKFGDHISTFGNPTSFNIVEIEPLRGNSLFILDGQLVFSLVETFFGGDGNVKKEVQEREFTPSELSITRRFLDIILKDTMEAWQPIYPIQLNFINAEMNHSLAKIVTPSELVVVQSFQIDLDTGSGEFHLVMPFSMIDPIRAVLDAGVQSDMDSQDPRWMDAIKSQVLDAQIEISCVMQEVQVSLNDIIKLNKGDIIPIEMPDRTKIEAQGAPIFEAKFGVHEGHYAAQILKFISQGDK